MTSITVLLPNDQSLLLRAEAFRVDDNGYLYVGTIAIFAPGQWRGVYETEKGTL